MTPIRPARSRDAALLAALNGQLGYPSTEDQLRARVAALADRSAEDAVLVATAPDDRPIGWIHVARVRSLTDDGLAIVGGLVVHDGHRSRGIGADLLAAAEAWARQHGATHLVVRTRTTRTRAHRFYEREGYRLTKESRVYEKTL
jgi:GNAT superfamily N-acetyltransferase